MFAAPFCHIFMFRVVIEEVGGFGERVQGIGWMCTQACSSLCSLLHNSASEHAARL